MVAAQKIQQGLQAVWNMQSQQCCCQAVRHVLQNTWSCKVLLQLQQHCCKSGIKALLQSRPKSTVAKHMQLQSIAEPIQVTSFLNSWIFHMTCYVMLSKPWQLQYTWCWQVQAAGLVHAAVRPCWDLSKLESWPTGCKTYVIANHCCKAATTALLQSS